MELSILNLFLVLLSAWIAGSVVSRLGYPAIFGELMVGIILGPPLIGLLEVSEALSVLAEVGVLLMMLYIGMEIDPKELFKASWGGFLAAIGGFITPFILAYLVMTGLFDSSSMAGLFVGIAAGVTSLATKSRILADLKLLDTRIAHVMMVGALMADTLSLIVFAAIVSVNDIGTLEIGQIVIVALEVTVFFSVTIFTGLKIFPIAWAKLSQLGLTNRTFHATLLLLVTLLFAELAELAGLHAILGAFLAGLFIREAIAVERRLAGELTELVRDISIGFLAPIFFVTAGFHVTLDVFTSSLDVLIAVVFVATFGKIAGTAAFYVFSGNGWREGITIGAGMNGRGAVEIIIAEIALTRGIITQDVFSVLVFMAICTTATVPVSLKWGTDWLRRRGELKRSSDDRTGTTIVGAGPLACAIAKAMGNTTKVWLIDNNMDRCNAATSEGLSAFYGDSLDELDLTHVEISGAHWFLALTANTEVNILAAQLARNVFNVPEIGVLLTRSEKGSLTNMLSEIGAAAIDDKLFDFTGWNQRLVNHRDFETIEIDIDMPINVSAFLEDLDDDSIPLVVMSENGQRVPFITVERLKAGETVVVLRGKLYVPQNMELVMAY
jgi:Kef-type K+ transport system membrane component KefB